MIATTIAYQRVRAAFDTIKDSTGTPIEHEASLPMPTLRWQRPLYAGFAGPATKHPGRPIEFGSPDRWWTVDAATGGLVSFNLVSFLSFPGELSPGSVSRPRTGRSAAVAVAELDLLIERMQPAAAAFFAGSAPEPETTRVVESLRAHLSAGELQWYRALAPDFFSWLEAQP